MDVDPLTLMTILGMALVTYATRAGGLWLMGRVQASLRVEAWLQQIPGAVLVSIVAPLAVKGGPADATAALLTAFIAARTRNLLLAMAAGVVMVWILRRVI
jgi:uncharacterized membrane protein